MVQHVPARAKLLAKKRGGKENPSSTLFPNRVSVLPACFDPQGDGGPVPLSLQQTTGTDGWIVSSEPRFAHALGQVTSSVCLRLSICKMGEKHFIFH